MPAVMCAPPDFTEAVNRTALPEATVVIGLPAEVTASVIPEAGMTVSVNAAEVTGPRCPAKVAIASPVAGSQSRAVASSDAVATRVPSGDKAADQSV